MRVAGSQGRHFRSSLRIISWEENGGGRAEAGGGPVGPSEGGSDHICLQFSSSPPHPHLTLPSIIIQLPVLVRPRPPA